MAVIARKANDQAAIIYTTLKTNNPYNEQKFLERKEATNQKRVNRMMNELTRLGFAISLAA
jgi:hypothetical protein